MSAALTLVPVSAKAAELLHALYADALAVAEASLQVPPSGSVILPPPRTRGLSLTYYNEVNGYRQLCLHSGDRHYSIRLQTSLIGDPQYEHFRPGRWYGSEERIDAEGRRWQSSLPTQYVSDDFGDLVEVPR